MKTVTEVVDNDKPTNETSHELDQQDIERDANQPSPKDTLPVRRSTGPRTKRGRAKASRNALKLGFFSKHVPIQTPFFKEDRATFKRLLNDLAEEWQPVGATEEIQLELVALQLLQYLRVLRVQEAQVAKHNTPVVPDTSVYFRIAEEELREEASRTGPEEGARMSEVDISNELEGRVAEKFGDILRREKQISEEHERLEKRIEGPPNLSGSDRLLNYGERILRQYYRALSELERLQRMRLGDKVPPRFVVELQSN